MKNYLFRKMTCHLGHKIDWIILSNSIEYYKSPPISRNTCVHFRNANDIHHFAVTFMRTLQEFADSAEDNSDLKYDLLLNDGMLHDVEILKSIMCSYIGLNLLLADDIKFNKEITDNVVNTMFINPNNLIFKCCAGNLNDNHPEWLSNMFKELIQGKYNNYEFKVFNQEITDKLRSYLKELFKCLYLHIKHGNEGKISISKIISNICWMFNIDSYIEEACINVPELIFEIKDEPDLSKLYNLFWKGYNNKDGKLIFKSEKEFINRYNAVKMDYITKQNDYSLNQW